MIPVLAISLGGPMGLMLGILVTAALGCAAGYVIGSALGRTGEGTSMATTVRLARERLASATTQLDRAATSLNSAHKPDLAGNAMVLRRRIAELSTDLGRLERKAQKGEEASA